MNVDPIRQYRPAPQFEQEQIAVAPATMGDAPLDLDAMAVHLDQMKVEAIIDAERTRPGLNAFFALILATGVSYIAFTVARYAAGTSSLRDRQIDVVDIPRAAAAIGVGLVAAIAVGIWSAILTRRTRRTVRAYEQRLIALGGTPLPDRGPPPPARSPQVDRH